ncbi:MAG: hypothetical protein LBB90_03960 [Tannerella sp.]|jgi:hypothetical protein|nr:hypothetical protein [Tannerella sp.]
MPTDFSGEYALAGEMLQQQLCCPARVFSVDSTIILHEREIIFLQVLFP